MMIQISLGRRDEDVPQSSPGENLVSGVCSVWIRLIQPLAGWSRAGHARWASQDKCTVPWWEDRVPTGHVWVPHRMWWRLEYTPTPPLWLGSHVLGSLEYRGLQGSMSVTEHLISKWAPWRTKICQVSQVQKRVPSTSPLPPFSD